jgi:hypothetical protein
MLHGGTLLTQILDTKFRAASDYSLTVTVQRWAECKSAIACDASNRLSARICVVG